MAFFTDTIAQYKTHTKGDGKLEYNFQLPESIPMFSEDLKSLEINVPKFDFLIDVPYTADIALHFYIADTKVDVLRDRNFWLNFDIVPEYVNKNPASNPAATKFFDLSMNQVSSVKPPIPLIDSVIRFFCVFVLPFFKPIIKYSPFLIN